MKFVSRLLLTFFIFLFLVAPVYSQTGCDTCGNFQNQEQTQAENQEEVREQVRTANPDLGELRQNVIEKREIIREKIQERQATLAARLAEKNKERIRNFFGRMTKRFQAAINRLERLISRIESRLSKIESEDKNIDTTGIREDVDEAKDKLAEASAALSEANTSLEDILTSDNPGETFAELRELLKGIKEQLKEVHQILVHVIGDIKGLRTGQTSPQPEVTPTQEATPGGE